MLHKVLHDENICKINYINYNSGITVKIIGSLEMYQEKDIYYARIKHNQFCTKLHKIEVSFITAWNAECAT